MESELRAWIEAEVDLTLAEICARLAARAGIQIKVPALWHQLDKWNLTLKKTLHASEQEREDVRLARWFWLKNQPAVDSQHLVFIDETWTSTNMTRARGRAPQDQRCVASVPHGHRQTTTFVGALRQDRLIAPMVTDGPIDGEMFLAYTRQFMAPALRPGDLVVLDNLGSHKVRGVRKAIEAAGATLLYLPPYSPDLNPIEKLFSKLKALLRRAATRTVESLWTEIGALLKTISPRSAATTLRLVDMLLNKSKML
jgi:transposase